MLHQTAPKRRWVQPASAGLGERLEKASSVLVNPEEPDSVQLRKLGDEHGEQRQCVDGEVDPVVLGVEAGEEVPSDDREKEKRTSDNRKTET